MPSSSLLRSLSILLAAAALLTQAAIPEACWYPDGSTQAPDLPCNGNGTASGCCNADAWCLENGMCWGNGAVSRGSCTDKNWGPGCPQYCATINTSGGMALTPCDPAKKTFVCELMNDNCASDTDIFVVDGVNNIMLRASQVASLQDGNDVMILEPTTVLRLERGSVIDSDGGISSGGQSGSTVTVTSVSDAGYTAGEVAGVGAGVGVPLLLALLGAIFAIVRQRKQLKSHSSAAHQRYYSSRPNYAHPYQSSDAYTQPPTTVPPMAYHRINTSNAKHAGQSPGTIDSPNSQRSPQAQFREATTPVREMEGTSGRQELAGNKEG